jgi:hypothetical protein
MVLNTELLPLFPSAGPLDKPAPPAPTVTVKFVDKAQDKAVSKLPPPPVAVTVERSPPAPPPAPIQSPPDPPPATTK